MSALADLSLDTYDDVVVGRIKGEIDRSNARRIAAALLEGVPNLALSLVVDLSGTTYVDSAGVELLFDLESRLSRRQQQLWVAVPPDAQIMRVLSVVSLESRIPMRATVEEAVNAARGDDTATG